MLAGVHVSMRARGCAGGQMCMVGMHTQRKCVNVHAKDAQGGVNT